MNAAVMADLPTSTNSISPGDNDPKAAREAKARQVEEILKMNFGENNIISVGAGIGARHAHQFAIVLARGYSPSHFEQFGISRDEFRKKPTEGNDPSTMWMVDERVIDRIIDMQKGLNPPGVA